MIGIIALAIVGVAPVAALVAVLHRNKSGRLLGSDLGALTLPPVLFIIIGLARPALWTGWAMFVWPIIIFVVCAYAYAARVILVRTGIDDDQRISRVFFAVSLLGAAIVATTVSPWYD